MFRAIVAAVYIAGGQVVIPGGAPVHVNRPISTVEQTVKVQATKTQAIEQPARPQQTHLIALLPANKTGQESLLVRLFRRAKRVLSWNKYKQSNIKYDSVGRATSYHLKTTQIEHYESFKQIQKGYRRKVASAWKTESVTTESDVQVLEFDGFGRQVHTVTTSQRNDVNQTYSRTDTVIKSFDEQGRAKDVKRTTDTRMTLAKSSGKLAAKFQKSFIGKAFNLSLKIPLIAFGDRFASKMAQFGSMAALGFEGAALVGGKDNWLGGQRIYSHNVVDQTMVYGANGQVDEEKTKAQTRTLENDSYMQGKNFGDKAMMAQDIAVAVVAAVISIIFPPMAIVMAAVLLVYNSMRQGISTHDLGLFGKNSDRGEQGKKNRQQFWTGVAMIAVAWLASAAGPAKDAGTAAKTAKDIATVANAANSGAKAAETVKTVSALQKAGQALKSAQTFISKAINFNRGSQMLWRFGTQIGAGSINGMDKRTFWKVAAITAASALVSGAISSSAGAGPGTTATQGQRITQAAWEGSGKLITEVGTNFGSAKQRTTWTVVGGAVGSGSGDLTRTATSVGESMALLAYSKKNDTAGSSDVERYRQGMVMSAMGDLAGSTLGMLGKIGLNPITIAFNGIKGMATRLTSKPSPAVGANRMTETKSPWEEVKPANAGTIPTRLPENKAERRETTPRRTPSVIETLPGADTILKLIPGGKEGVVPAPNEKPIERKNPGSLFEKLDPLFKMDPGVPLFFPKGLNPLKVQGYIVGELYASAKEALGLWDGEVVSPLENAPTTDDPPMLLASARMAPDGVTVQREPVKPVEAPKQAVAVNTKETKLQNVLEFNPELSAVAPAASKGLWSTIKSKTAAYVDDAKMVAGFVKEKAESTYHTTKMNLEEAVFVAKTAVAKVYAEGVAECTTVAQGADDLVTQAKATAVSATNAAMTWTATLTNNTGNQIANTYATSKQAVVDEWDSGQLPRDVIKGVFAISPVPMGMGVLTDDVMFGGIIEKDPIPGFKGFPGSIDPKVQTASGREIPDFFVAQKPSFPGFAPSAVFDIRHTYRTPPVVNMFPHSPLIKFIEGEKASGMSVLFNQDPQKFVTSIKASSAINFIVHGFNVTSGESLSTREKFSAGFRREGYNNINSLISWSGDVGNNFLSKVVYFNRAVKSAELSWKGVDSAEQFIKSYNPDIKFNAVTHSLGAGLTLNAAGHGVKFNTVIFLVPAVERNAFSAGGKYEKAIQNIGHVVVVFSRKQEFVFGTSYPIATFSKAAGGVGPTGVVNHPDFTVIDTTKASRNDFGVEINKHGDIFEPKTMQMIIHYLEKNK